MKKIFLPLLILPLVGGFGIWWHFRDSADLPGDSLTLYGHVEIRDAQLAFNEQEQIAEVLVEEGDTVEKGQIVARLRKDRLTAMAAEAEAAVQAQQQVVARLENGTRPEKIAEARAEVELSKAQTENAKADLARLKQTAKAGAISLQDLDTAEAAYKVEQAILEKRRKALDLAVKGPRAEEIREARKLLDAQRAKFNYLQIRLREADLTAPAAGIVQSRILEPGEMAAPNRPVLTLALMDPKWVRVFVNEPDLGRIREGMQAEVLSDSYPEKRYDGWIGFISPTAEFTPKNVETTDLRPKLVYETRVYVKDPENELRLGMPVTVQVSLQGK